MPRHGLPERARVPAPKVRIPPVHPRHVARTRLLRLLDPDLLGPDPVVLVSAPAGSGKTSLLSAWANQRPDGSSAHPVAWVSLDGADNDVFPLWSAVLAALETTGRWPPGALRQLGPPRGQMDPEFLAALVAAVGALSDPVWLVLDGVHELREGAAPDSLDLLLHNLPARLRLVLSTRSEPALGLHRLRLAGRLVEIGADELAFTRQEATALLSGQRIRLSAADLDLLLGHTEGWAAGLRLAALALAGAADQTAALAEFGGHTRAVADYLRAEVLAGQSEQVRELLLSVSVCAQCTAELGAALSGHPDAGQLLDRLERANALVRRPDPAGTWYRCHPLLREYLRAELARRDATAIPRLHADAARWFAAHGRPAEATEHAVEAGDTELAGDLLADTGPSRLVSGEGADLLRLVDRLGPDALTRPSTALVAAAAAVDGGDLVTADAYLAAAADRDGPRDRRAEVLRATTVLHRARLGGDRDTARVALRDLPDPTGSPPGTATGTGDADLDLLALLARGTALVWFGDHAAAEQVLRQALDLATARGRDEAVLRCLVGLTGAAVAAGDLVEVAARAEAALAFADRDGGPPRARCAEASTLAAWAAHHRFDRDTAESCLAAAAPLRDARTDPEVELSAGSVEAIVRFDTAEDRHAVVGALRDRWQRAAGRAVAPWLVAYEAPAEQRLALRVGELGWATEVAERTADLLGESAETCLVRAVLQVRRGRVDQARGLLRPVLDGDLRGQVATTEVDAWLLEAVLAEQADDGFRAHQALGAAVEWAAPRRVVRAFVDAGQPVRTLLVAGTGRFGRHEAFAAEVLDAMPPALPGPSDVLTPREMDLLAELPSMRTAEEIAESMLVSVNTVKTHLRGIYQKLGVNNRRDAITTARQRGLL